MKNIIYGTLLSTVLAWSVAPASATILDVTGNSQVTLQTNDSLKFYISATGGGFGYPGEIDMLLGGMPLGGPVASIPGTSGIYMTGILFTGTLKSTDGSTSIPLIDAGAAHLGLPAGNILLTSGSRSGGSYSGPIDVLAARAAVDAHQASAFFTSGEAIIDLINTGAPITFAVPGTTLANNFSASLISPDGAQSIGARILRVECVHVPEPGTVGLLILGFTILGSRLARGVTVRSTTI